MPSRIFFKNIINLFAFSITIFLISVSHSEENIDRKEIESIIHEYIMNNPELIIKSVEKLRQVVEQEDDDKKNFLIKNFELFANYKNIPWQGEENASVILIEFFDYNCGYCKKSLDAITNILKSYNNIKVSFRDYPILSTTSTSAAKAALAAQKQGKYFNFHSNLMKFQGNLTKEEIFNIAKSSGLKIKQLKLDMDDPEIAAIINDTHDLAKSLGIRGTPTFLINGKLFAGALDENRLKFLIDEALSEI